MKHEEIHSLSIKEKHNARALFFELYSYVQGLTRRTSRYGAMALAFGWRSHFIQV
jgi:hypothetical protein